MPWCHDVMSLWDSLLCPSPRVAVVLYPLLLSLRAVRTAVPPRSPHTDCNDNKMNDRMFSVLVYLTDVGGQGGGETMCRLLHPPPTPPQAHAHTRAHTHTYTQRLVLPTFSCSSHTALHTALPQPSPPHSPRLTPSAAASPTSASKSSPGAARPSSGGTCTAGPAAATSGPCTR